jgi:hypothetical protein
MYNINTNSATTPLHCLARINSPAKIQKNLQVRLYQLCLGGSFETKYFLLSRMISIILFNRDLIMTKLPLFIRIRKFFRFLDLIQFELNFIPDTLPLLTHE